MVSVSPDYQPLPANWQLPDWMPPSPKLHPIDEAISQRITAVTRGKVSPQFNSEAPGIKAKHVNIINGLANLSAIGVFFVSSSKAWYVRIMAALAARFVAYSGLFFISRFVLDRSFSVGTMMSEALKNPLFREISEKVNSKGMETVAITMQDANAWPFPYESIGAYQFKLMLDRQHITHNIFLKEGFSFNNTFSFLIFEHCNALQAERLIALETQVASGHVSKEDYAILCEGIELTTQMLARQIIDYGIEHLSWPTELDLWSIEGQEQNKLSFEKNWADRNIIRTNEEISHADGYRRQWDSRFSQAYATAQEQKS